MTCLIPDITETILSDYIEYDQLVSLMDKIPHLKININRIRKDISYYVNMTPKKIETYIDSILRKVEAFYGDSNKEYLYNYNNGYRNGEYRHWYKHGQLMYLWNYVNDKIEGKQYAWFGNGDPLHKI